MSKKSFRRKIGTYISLSFSSSSRWEEYQELYKLQTKQLEEQVLLLAQERDVWRSAVYDLAQKAGAGDQSYVARDKPLSCSKGRFRPKERFYSVRLGSDASRTLPDLSSCGPLYFTYVRFS